MYSKQEIREYFNKGFTTQAYKAMIAEYAESFEKLDFKVVVAKLKEELDLPIKDRTLYMIYYRKRKEKEREKNILLAEPSLTTPQEVAPGEGGVEHAIRERLDKLDQRAASGSK